MISLHIQFDQQQMARIEAQLQGVKNGAPRAMTRAINRTVTYGKTLSKKLIREEYTINAQAVQRATTTEKARMGNLQGIIRFKGRPKQLRNFAKRSTSKGVAVAVKKGSGRTVIPRSFIRTINSGPAIMRRTGTARYPIEVLHGPSVPQMAGNVNVAPRIQTQVRKKLGERLEHEVGAILKGYVK